jgi:DNA-binding response OmpR family regulator
VRVDGADVHLTPIEFDLLGCLARKPGVVSSRESLLAEVWDWADASGTRTVDSHIKALRKKIGAEWIRTVHGIGYALEAEIIVPAPDIP